MWVRQLGGFIGGRSQPRRSTTVHVDEAGGDVGVFWVDQPQGCPRDVRRLAEEPGRIARPLARLLVVVIRGRRTEGAVDDAVHGDALRGEVDGGSADKTAE